MVPLGTPVLKSACTQGSQVISAGYSSLTVVSKGVALTYTWQMCLYTIIEQATIVTKQSQSCTERRVGGTPANFFRTRTRHYLDYRTLLNGQLACADNVHALCDTMLCGIDKCHNLLIISSGDDTLSPSKLAGSFRYQEHICKPLSCVKVIYALRLRSLIIRQSKWTTPKVVGWGRQAMRRHRCTIEYR